MADHLWRAESSTGVEHLSRRSLMRTTRPKALELISMLRFSTTAERQEADSAHALHHVSRPAGSSGPPAPAAHRRERCLQAG
ncbi:unnamed protein product [Nesidiocoris tenuis]|uniref:Uncharacterized protein n=1 Tax=Nesidiocoris tenuis TaxID=355587 RepID=A0A6H5HFV8_9HEMI|nr:unnamed protein product [Nesidiocoris tenuis]CAB0015498.1 unnamed protein product [Nesidiocoris tenuis]